MDIFWNFEGFSQILKEQSGKKLSLGVFTQYTSNSNNLKIWKQRYLKKNSGVCVIIYYQDTGFSIFTIEYLCENEKVHETIVACSYGA